MTSRYVEPDAIHRRYETHLAKTLTLYVIRQDQQFVINYDKTLTDIKLIRSSVELVGEPGTSAVGEYVGRGYVSGDLVGSDKYGATINQRYAMNFSDSSKVLGVTAPNAVVHRTDLNHGWVNLEISGMTEGQNFMRDTETVEGQLSLVVPTDHGILQYRAMQQTMSGHPIRIDAVKLDPTIRVHTEFGGSGSRQKRLARFVEDFADENPAEYRFSDGTVKYFSDDPAASLCIIPANLITCMVLQFEVTPRATL